MDDHSLADVPGTTAFNEANEAARFDEYLDALADEDES